MKDANNDLTNHNALDPLTALSSQSRVKNARIFGLRAAHITAHFHHLARVKSVILTIYYKNIFLKYF